MHIYIYIHTYVCVYVCNVVCVCANVYSMNKYVYMHTSMCLCISPPLWMWCGGGAVGWWGGEGNPPMYIYI